MPEIKIVNDDEDLRMLDDGGITFNISPAKQLCSS